MEKKGWSQIYTKTVWLLAILYFLYHRVVGDFINLRYGERKIAGQIIEELLQTGNTNFNHLHKEVLLFDNEELRPFRENSARKKPFDNMQVSVLILCLIEKAFHFYFAIFVIELANISHILIVSNGNLWDILFSKKMAFINLEQSKTNFEGIQ